MNDEWLSNPTIDFWCIFESLKIRKFVVKDPSNRDAAVLYLDGIINSQMIQIIFSLCLK